MKEVLNLRYPQSKETIQKDKTNEGERRDGAKYNPRWIKDKGV